MATLDHKVALVTGAAGGVGSAIVRRFVAAGALVFASEQCAAHDRGGDDGWKPPSGSGTVTRLNLDVTDEAQWRDAAAAIRSRHGGLDVLVHCAALLQPGYSVETTTLDAWRNTFRVNAEGTFLACRYAIELMRGRAHASIITIASAAAVRAAVKAPAYGASKAAVVAFTRTVALHCAERGYGIRANVILPGAVDTPMLHRNIGTSGMSATDYLRRLREAHPIGRIGQPDDIAAAALFLASEDSGFVTGTEFVVDGGQTI